MASGRVLYQFPISHYCEKTRWNLDAKALGYEVKNLLPGVHAVVNKRLAGRRTVPVLVDGDRAIGDSTEIALYLEDRYEGRSLLPASGEERSRALELEHYFDTTFGPAVRRWIYGEALKSPGLVPTLFFAGYGGMGRLVGRFVGPMLSMQIRRMYRIDEGGIAESSARIDEAASRLEAELGGDPDRYLVGGRLTLADVTAASLLAPLVGPPGSPYADLTDAPESVVARRGEMQARVAGRWVMQRYARDRRSPLPA